MVSFSVTVLVVGVVRDTPSSRCPPKCRSPLIAESPRRYCCISASIQARLPSFRRRCTPSPASGSPPPPSAPHRPANPTSSAAASGRQHHRYHDRRQHRHAPPAPPALAPIMLFTVRYSLCQRLAEHLLQLFAAHSAVPAESSRFRPSHRPPCSPCRRATPAVDHQRHQLAHLERHLRRGDRRPRSRPVRARARDRLAQHLRDVARKVVVRHPQRHRCLPPSARLKNPLFFGTTIVSAPGQNFAASFCASGVISPTHSAIKLSATSSGTGFEGARPFTLNMPPHGRLVAHRRAQPVHRVRRESTQARPPAAAAPPAPAPAGHAR